MNPLENAFCCLLVTNAAFNCPYSQYFLWLCCYPCRTILVYGLGLWPRYFYILFYCKAGDGEGWHKPFLFVPDNDVYNFVCTLEIYCNTFWLVRGVSIVNWKPVVLRRWIRSFECRTVLSRLEAALLACATGGSAASVLYVISVTAPFCSAVPFSLQICCLRLAYRLSLQTCYVQNRYTAATYCNCL